MTARGVEDVVEALFLIEDVLRRTPPKFRSECLMDWHEDKRSLFPDDAMPSALSLVRTRVEAGEDPLVVVEDELARRGPAYERELGESGA
jgi:hypothetical protein